MSMEGIMSYLMNTIKTIPGLEIEHAEDSYLYGTLNGEVMKWIDLFNDSGVCSLGYDNHIKYHLKRALTPHMPNIVSFKFRENVAEELCDMTKMNKVFFCNSGTEAIESAIKIMRKASTDTKKRYIYTYANDFHGRTYGALAASDGPSYHYEGFGPHLQGFKHFKYPHQIDWDVCSGILMSTVFGNHDVMDHGIAELKYLRSMCDRHRIPLCLDEIQCGAGRCGTFNAFDRYAIVPDILCLAKGIACGNTLGACLARGRYANTLTPGSHFSTFGGGIYGLLGVFEYISKWRNGDLNYQDIENKAHLFKIKLEVIKEIDEIRQVGLMIAVKVKDDTAKLVSRKLLEKGVFLPTFRSDVLKMAPALTIKAEEIELSMNTLQDVMEEVYS